MLFIYTYKRFNGVPAAEVLSTHEASLCYSFTRINALVEFRQRSSAWKFFMIYQSYARLYVFVKKPKIDLCRAL